MNTTTLHTAAGRWHRAIAALLTAIYLLIAAGPLPSLALQHHQHAHDRQTACSGDCKRDGCSLQSQLNRTCCCWKKKQQENHPLGAATDRTDCCHTTLPAELVRSVLEETTAIQQEQRPEPKTAETVFKCGCPCNGSSQSALLNSQNHEIMPFFHRVVIVPPEEPPYPLSPGSNLYTLSSKPLVPPPKPV